MCFKLKNASTSPHVKPLSHPYNTRNKADIAVFQHSLNLFTKKQHISAGHFKVHSSPIKQETEKKSHKTKIILIKQSLVIIR